MQPLYAPQVFVNIGNRWEATWALGDLRGERTNLAGFADIINHLWRKMESQISSDEILPLQMSHLASNASPERQNPALEFGTIIVCDENLVHVVISKYYPVAARSRTA